VGRRAHWDPDGADLLAQPIRPDHEDVVGPGPAALEVVRGRVAAGDDVLAVTAESELLETSQVLIAGRGRVVRGEKYVPGGPAQARQRLARVGHDLRAAVEHAVHVEDRNRHRATG